MAAVEAVWYDLEDVDDVDGPGQTVSVDMWVIRDRVGAVGPAVGNGS